MFRQFWRQICVFGKESRKQCRFNRANALGIKAILSKRRDVFVAENFDVRVWIGVAQCLQRRESENEIADRAAANDKNPSQLARLILSEGAAENRQTVSRRDTVHRAPARVAVRAPIDLVAQ